MKNLNGVYRPLDKYSQIAQDNFKKMLINVYGEIFYKMHQTEIFIIVIYNTGLVVLTVSGITKSKKDGINIVCRNKAISSIGLNSTNQQVIDWAFTRKDLLYIIHLGDIIDLCDEDVYTFICRFTAKLDEMSITSLYIGSKYHNIIYIDGGIPKRPLKTGECMKEQWCNSGQVSPSEILTAADIAQLMHWKYSARLANVQDIKRKFTLLVQLYLEKTMLGNDEEILRVNSEMLALL